MSSVGAREANRSFSKLLKEAEGGNAVTITRNGRPVARLVPIAVPPRSHSMSEKQRKKAREDFIALLEKGLNLGGKGFTRNEMHER